MDGKGHLVTTFIGKQEEITIRESLDSLEGETKPNAENFNDEFSVIKENKSNKVNPRSHS